MMNLESVITYEGTHDIHLLILGQEDYWDTGFCMSFLTTESTEGNAKGASGDFIS
ncbi:hypothetical protein J2X69_004291 [Algoriphagus sp. 4150]|nr:hypothetical protein [Algoriphagus sp. 4150]MDR7131925.1 hypothetical protein [Algoriphagus sp. 4150]